MTSLPKVMVEAIGVAVLKLIGGEELVLYSPNAKLDLPTLLNQPSLPDNVQGYGAAVVRVAVNNFPATAYAYHVDERCRELFGFGLIREGGSVCLRRPKEEQSSLVGYSYTMDKLGRAMIIGDYAHELNNAYMRMINTPMQAYVENDYEFVMMNNARVYLADIRQLARWCGDELVISSIGARIVPPKEKISEEE